MNLNSYQPWSLINQLNQNLGVLQRPAPNDRTTRTSLSADWNPAVDIAETDSSFVLRADIPGVNPAEIELSMEDGVLTLSGERLFEKTESDEGLRRAERRSGKFSRRFSLPDTADAEGITASSEYGVLEIRIPKQAKAEPRRINVSTN